MNREHPELWLQDRESSICLFVLMLYSPWAPLATSAFRILLVVLGETLMPALVIFDIL